MKFRQSRGYTTLVLACAVTVVAASACAGDEDSTDGEPSGEGGGIVLGTGGKGSSSTGATGATGATVGSGGSRSSNVGGRQSSSGGSGAAAGEESDGGVGAAPAAGGSSAGSNASGGVGGTPSSGSGGTRNSGGGGSGGSGSGSGGTRSSGSGGSGTAGSGSAAPASAPVLPAITGECPKFATGTATIGGLSGISMQVGTKGSGTGSLVFYWHGTGSSASEVNAFLPAAVRQEILSQGGIIASFQGSLKTGGDCSGTAIFSKDDFKVADQIAACAVRDQGIDPRRIYTTGCSAGGLQSGCMGALRSSYIAAVVPNSGGEVVKQPIQDPSRIPAVMTMHGGASDQVIVSFSQTSSTFDSHMDAAGGFVINCNHGGGHCGAPAMLQSAGWEFMKAHPFGTKPSPYASGLPASFPNYCKAF